MAEVNVLVVFYSRYGRAERLALAAGVGAIEAEGNIRLRRLPDHATAETIQADAAWRASLDRMNRDYVAPRPGDPPWADVIVLATPADASAHEVQAYVATLPGLGSMRGKIAAPLAPDDQACDAVFVAAARAGLICVPVPVAAEGAEADPVTRARVHGQRIVQLARALKSSS